MSESSIAPLIISSLALAVSGTAALSTFVFNTKKSARELWQKQLEIYIANPAHLLGRPTKGTEESKQAYRAHVIFTAVCLSAPQS